MQKAELLQPSRSPLPNYSAVKDRRRGKQNRDPRQKVHKHGICSPICIILPSEYLPLFLIKELSIRSSPCRVNLFSEDTETAQKKVAAQRFQLTVSSFKHKDTLQSTKRRCNGVMCLYLHFLIFLNSAKYFRSPNMHLTALVSLFCP